MAYKKTDKLIKYNNQFNKENYDRISLMIQKGRKEQLQALAKANGESVNKLINRLIEAEIERMGGTVKLDADGTGTAAGSESDSVSGVVLGNCTPTDDATL